MSTEFVYFLSSLSLIISVLAWIEARKSASYAKDAIESDQPIIIVDRLDLDPVKLTFHLINKGKSHGFINQIDINIGGNHISELFRGDNIVLIDKNLKVDVGLDGIPKDLYSSLSEINGSGTVMYRSIIGKSYNSTFECMFENLNDTWPLTNRSASIITKKISTISMISLFKI